MASSALHAVATEFEERHVPLHLALGLVAVLRRLRGPLGRSAAVPAAAEAQPGRIDVVAARGGAPDEPALLFLLGVVALSRSLMDRRTIAWLPRAGAAGRRPPVSGESGRPPEPPHGLLR